MTPYAIDCGFFASWGAAPYNLATYAAQGASLLRPWTWRGPSHIGVLYRLNTGDIVVAQALTEHGWTYGADWLVERRQRSAWWLPHGGVEVLWLALRSWEQAEAKRQYALQLANTCTGYAWWMTALVAGHNQLGWELPALDPEALHTGVICSVGAAMVAARDTPEYDLRDSDDPSWLDFDPATFWTRLRARCG